MRRKDMKLFRIAGVAATAAALAACSGGATEENTAATDNLVLETENLDVGSDLNATDLNAVTIDANSVTVNDVTLENAAGGAANAADNATNAQ
jgi:Flp pilus assembly protein CpaB